MKKVKNPYLRIGASEVMFFCRGGILFLGDYIPVRERNLERKGGNWGVSGLWKGDCSIYNRS